MLVLKKGCCCSELETCACVVGWLGVAFAILNSARYFIVGFQWGSTPIYIVIGIFHLIISGFLIKSTKDREPNLVMSWLISVVLETILIITVHVIVLIQQPHGNDILAASIIAMLAGTALTIYIWLCIYSYYQLLSSNKQVKRLIDE